GVVEHTDGHSPVTGLALVLGQATKIVRSLAHSRDRPSVTKFKGKSKRRRVVHFQQRNSPQPLNLQRTGLRSSTAVSLECVGRPQRVRPVFVSQLLLGHMPELVVAAVRLAVALPNLACALPDFLFSRLGHYANFLGAWSPCSRGTSGIVRGPQKRRVPNSYGTSPFLRLPPML